MGKFTIKTSGNEFYFNLKAGNGEIILTGERYKSKQGCNNGIASVKKNASVESRYDTKTSKDGKTYFNLKAANGEIIGTSETYNSTSACKNGIATVMKNAPTADIIEE